MQHYNTVMNIVKTSNQSKAQMDVYGCGEEWHTCYSTKYFCSSPSSANEVIHILPLVI